MGEIITAKYAEALRKDRGGQNFIALLFANLANFALKVHLRHSQGLNWLDQICARKVTRLISELVIPSFWRNR